MRLRLAVVVFCLLPVLASHVVQRSGASAGSNADREADLANIEKFHQRDIAAKNFAAANFGDEVAQNPITRTTVNRDRPVGAFHV